MLIKSIFRTISHVSGRQITGTNTHSSMFIKTKYIFILSTKIPKSNVYNQLRYLCSAEHKCTTETIKTYTTELANNVTPDRYRCMMRKLPQTVVLITTAVFKPEADHWFKRGLTCSSLLSISLHPPIVSFCLHKHSQISKLLRQSQQFAVNFIGEHQVKCADIFSTPPQQDEDQFSGVSHYLTKEGLPVLNGTPALLCKVNCIHNVEDRCVWYGQVTELLEESGDNNPVLHYNRAYHKVGASISATAPPSHIAPDRLTNYLHLIWSQVKEHGIQNSAYCIRESLQKNIPINDSNWHETVIQFYIDMVQNALKTETGHINTFEEFLLKNEEFVKPQELLFKYYSEDIILSEESRRRYLSPNKKSLPVL
ncbi:flavin reductase (NADH)-like isoform X2 [Octopus vulgaris]|uniref:Flavin reductase (NADH)-like isoform X2 n=1 Tax=Octopus vulgaris TaxID=6645 RepID=A0AA36F101_OCTVU|nr:flavin reductase (NADH)-like isoform X2 [Octopus vulgaris]